jgi:hypothetical protein
MDYQEFAILLLTLALLLLTLEWVIWYPDWVFSALLVNIAPMYS